MKQAFERNGKSFDILDKNTGEIATISRDVETSHPAWVHTQLISSSESELQQMLDGINMSDWYRDGKYLGRDICGLGISGESDAK